MNLCRVFADNLGRSLKLILIEFVLNRIALFNESDWL